MKIVKEYPPNYDEIAKKFTLHKGIVFTYGNILYNPDWGYIDEALIKHEETHMRQQAEIGVEKWWELYLLFADFRCSQEVEAYQNQYREIKKTVKDRNKLDKALRWLAMQLSHEMYGNVMTFQEARLAIKSEKLMKFDVNSVLAI